LKLLFSKLKLQKNYFNPMGYNLGVFGTGGFTHFSVKAFRKVDGINITAAYDIHPEALKQFCQEFQCMACGSPDDLLTSDEADIIYIGSPPYLHYAHSKEALLAGKHVICEKPAALHADEVEELIAIAKERKLLYVVNLMQRYNPLFPKIKSLVDEKLLGEFLHGYFENYASDESLDEDHWMWDEQKSGGIFIEHAVHFFDLVEGWLGKGELVASQKIRKQGKKNEILSEVQAICTYRNGLFNFYHGFHQANRMDRQELKLVFENGEVTLFEWVPARMLLKGLVTDKRFEALKELFPEARIDIAEFKEEEKRYRSHFSARKADYLVTMESGDDNLKLTIYQDLLTDMIHDQVRWLNDKNHHRRINDINALNSVIMAEQANNNAVIL
jgi:predicted dehydrogenase